MTTPVLLKRVVEEIDVRAGSDRPPLLSVSIHHGVVPRSEITDDLSRADDLTNYKLCQQGDLVLNRMRAFQGAIGVSPAAGLVSPDYLVLRPRIGVSTRYLHHAFRSSWFVGEMTSRIRGIGSVELGTVRTPRINAEDLLAIEVPLPTAGGQRRIADFLDDQVARIDKIIAARRSQIELIDSRRVCELDSLINDPERPAARLALFARIQSGITVDAGRESVDGIDVPYLRVANVQAGALNLEEVKSIRVARSQVSRYLLRDGDVLMTEGGDIDKLGRGTVWRSQVPGAIHQNHVFAVRVEQSRLIPEYLAYVTASSPARHYFELTGNRTTNLASTSATKVLDLRVPERGVDEQARVVEAAEEADSRARAGTALLLDSIARVEELKRSLITAAVTGEFDLSSADGSRVRV